MSANTSKKVGNSGGKLSRAGMGRPKGAVNKATAEVRSLAQEHGPDAIEVLVYLMHKAQSERSRIAAATELLDRAYGKSVAAVDHTSGGKPLPTAPAGVLVVPAGMSVEDWEKLAAQGGGSHG
ncbi:hypothetical protein [Castellaniella sp.]|uniref:hypothetical protein n=1 Tax=Castellaniella sp. TaxID=1955812 RepID=UPI003A8DAFED